MKVSLSFQEGVQNVAREVAQNPPDRIVLLHHNDSDGLSAGAMLAAAFERLHIAIFRYCLEKPYPAVLQAIFNNPFLEGRVLLVLTDFGSGMLPELSKINAGRFDLLVLDHHSLTPTIPDDIKVLNPLLHEIDGSVECSASAVAYLFVEALADYNEDLLPLALIGGAGDGHFNSLINARGIHQENFNRAVAAGIVTDDGNFLKVHEGSLASLTNALDALGSVGYFGGGTDIAIKGLLEGFDSRYHMYGSQYQNEYEQKVASFLDGDLIRKEGNLYWFVLPDSFLGLGVKSVGLIANKIANSLPECADSYILGFQKIPNQVPGLGNIAIDGVKASMRVGCNKRKAVLAKKAPLVSELIEEFARCNTDSFVDACHKHAGAFVVPPETEEQTALEIAKLLGSNFCSDS